MSKLYSLKEIELYIVSQDSLGDVLYNLSEENVDKVIDDNNFKTIREQIVEDGNYDNEDDIDLETEKLYLKTYKKEYKY